MSRVHAITGHTHAADNVAMSALKVRKEIMDTAEASGGRPGQILAAKLATCPLEVFHSNPNRVCHKNSFDAHITFT